MKGKLRDAVFVTALSGFLTAMWGFLTALSSFLAAGASVGMAADLEQVTGTIARGWHRRGLELCNSIADADERAECLRSHRRMLGRVTWLRQELLAECRVASSEERRTPIVAALGETLRDLALQTPYNFGSPLDEDGRVHLVVTAARAEDQYIVQDGSEIGWSFGSDPIAFQNVSGSFSVTLDPDGNGGFTGTVDALRLTMEPAGTRTEARIRLTPGGQLGSVTLAPDGQGTLQFHGVIEHERLPPTFPWWFELPIESADPFVSIDLRSAADVPSEEILPVHSSTEDCNGNGVPDETDVQNGSSADCNGDKLPDECQWDSDFNGNGVLDECDILSGAAGDLNDNGIADDGEAELVRAFAFGSRALECFASDPRVEYTMVHHSGSTRRPRDALAYNAERGWGYEITHPGETSRSGFGQFGPFAEVPARAAKFGRDCPEALYDSRIGGSDFTQECSSQTVGEGDTPCAQGGIAPQGLVFRVDLPGGGRYRFVGAFGDAASPHAHRILVEDGGEGPPGAIGKNSITLVRNFDQAQQSIGQTDPELPGAGVYAAVGFAGRFPPRGDGIAPDPQFVFLNAQGLPSGGFVDSPELDVTQGYIRVHQLQGNSNDGPGGPRNPDGGDAVILELWKRTAYESTITVALDGTGDYTAMQPAIDAAAAIGTTILVTPGEYEITESLIFSGKEVRVRSAEGPEDTVIRMRTQERDVVIFEGGDTSLLEGFTLTGGALGTYCEDSSPTLTRCTIAGNSHGGVSSEGASFPALTSCIVWDNGGEAITGGDPEVTFSSIETDAVWPGEGNINADPLFCAWDGAEILVDEPSAFEDAMRFRLALAESSPCIGTGEGGVNMGADTGICARVGEAQRRIRLGPGTYELSGLSLHHQVSLEGVGEEKTVLEGTVFGLRTGAVLADLKIASGTTGGVQIAPGEAPELRNCTISGNSTSESTGNSKSGSRGGGVYCSRDSSPTLTSCTIVDNSTEHGGGVYCEPGSSPTLTDCTIAENSADRGGGVYCAGDASPTLTDCRISENSANRGGGVYCAEESLPILADCRISRNATEGAANEGGGVYCAEESAPLLTRCTLAENSAQRGGGVHCRGRSAPTLADCTISGNAAEDGGGVFAREESTPTLTDCAVSENSVAGVVCEGRTFPVLGNCTLSLNSERGLSCRGNSSPLLINCIVWGDDGDSIDVREGASPAVHYSCIEGPELWPGEGNINADPLFCAWGAQREVYVDSSALAPGDGTEHRPFSSLAQALAGYSFALSPDSPCLGAGERGVDMGAEAEPCEIRGETRLVHLAPGSYRMDGLDLAEDVSLTGAGARETIVEGTVRGLRTEALLSRLTVHGGVVVDAGESPEIASVWISGTTVSENEDRGVHCGTDASPTFTDCIISGHSGRGVHCAPGSSPTLKDCTISGNADRGVYCAGDSSPHFTNCTISGNQAARGFGGGVHCERDSSATFTSCTISGNSAGRGGGVYFAAESSGALSHCIVWTNEPDSIQVDRNSPPQVRYSCLEAAEVLTGEGNINADPLFCRAPAEEGFPLFLESPCIGTGKDGANMGADWGVCGLSERFLRGDCNGDSSAQGDVTDGVFLLSYNFAGGAEPPCVAACDADGDGQVTGQVNDAVYLLNFNFLGGPGPVAPFPECGQGDRVGDEALGCEEPPEVCE